MHEPVETQGQAGHRCGVHVRSVEITCDSSLDRCSRCNAFGPGLGWSFGYGLPSRGVNPRTLVTDDRCLGTDAVFLCSSCQRYLLWSSFRRFTASHGIVVAMSLIPVLIPIVMYGAKTEAVVDDEVVVGLLCIVVGCVLLGIRWLRRHTATMQRLCFEFRRAELARKWNVPSSSVTQYPPR